MNGTTPLEQASAQLKQAAQDACSIALARTYPDWSIWESRTGRWYATLCTPHRQVRAQPACTVEATGLDELAAQIAECDLPFHRDETDGMTALCRLAADALINRPRTGHADAEDTKPAVDVAIQKETSTSMAYPPPYCPTDRVSGLRMAALPNAVSCARRHTRHLLREWQLTEFADDIELAVSEIITNSVKAVGSLTLPVSYTAMYDQPPATVLLRLRLTTSSLYAEVWDPSEDLPSLTEAAVLDEGGRGLGLVAAVTDDWGFYLSQTGGKVTWCGIKLRAPEPHATHKNDPEPIAQHDYLVPDASRVRWELCELTHTDKPPWQTSAPGPFQPRCPKEHFAGSQIEETASPTTSVRCTTSAVSADHPRPTHPTGRSCIDSS